jgi:hypothetical protein
VELLTTGAFARASRLSPKALRLYDSLGLLPRRTWTGSGYRLYRPDQAAGGGLAGTGPGTGTTLIAMLWSGAQLALVHIGDTRAYLLRAGGLFQITHDHSVVQALINEGTITPAEAGSHPQRSLLLRAIDGNGAAEPDLSLHDVQAGDWYLLCTDGLTAVVPPPAIQDTLTAPGDPEQAVARLTELANAAGGPDNIGCVAVDVIQPERGPCRRLTYDQESGRDGRARAQLALPGPGGLCGRRRLADQRAAAEQDRGHDRAAGQDAGRPGEAHVVAVQEGQPGQRRDADDPGRRGIRGDVGRNGTGEDGVEQ